MGFCYARVVWVERILHTANPIIDNTIPTIGSSGIIGQRIISARLQIPPIIMVRAPVRSRIRRERKPINRDTSLSKNM